MKKIIANIIFTKRCPFCGQVILPYNECCKRCFEILPVIKNDVCVKCGLSFSECSCKRETREYDGICAPFYYRDMVSEAVQRFKFRGEKSIGEFFAKEMAQRIKLCFPDKTFHMIVPVPLYKKKLRERGYNQSMVLAKDIGKILKIPVCNVISKDFDTQAQHFTHASKREGNVAGVFSIIDPELVRGKTVLLCDDIKTTGHTLNECTKMLKLWGAEKVYCVCTCITQRSIDKDNQLK